MRALVYDFGQLTDMTEKDYMKEIVYNHCSGTHASAMIVAVLHLTAWCQGYMRKTQVKNSRDCTNPFISNLSFLQNESSFVSLRDVERTMIVFRFFEEKASYFKDFIAVKARAEVSQIKTIIEIHLCCNSSPLTAQDSHSGHCYMVTHPCCKCLLPCKTTG